MNHNLSLTYTVAQGSKNVFIGGRFHENLFSFISEYYTTLKAFKYPAGTLCPGKQLLSKGQQGHWESFPFCWSAAGSALFPLLMSHSFALAVNRGQVGLSDSNPCLPSDGSTSDTGSQTLLKGSHWSSFLLPQALLSPPSLLPAGGAGSSLSPARW